MPESRGQFEARLRREGRREEFQRRVIALKEQGDGGWVAYSKATLEFTPPPPSEPADERVPAATFAGLADRPADALGAIRWPACYAGVREPCLQGRR
ncbi:MAG: hypothetical protein C4547_16015 [Phycisphaerales bacterium]|nr:MAG: hypothetical protein C4547_16015 [Phycisphaerales bacterium]